MKPMIRFATEVIQRVSLMAILIITLILYAGGVFGGLLSGTGQQCPKYHFLS